MFDSSLQSIKKRNDGSAGRGALGVAKAEARERRRKKIIHMLDTFPSLGSCVSIPSLCPPVLPHATPTLSSIASVWLDFKSGKHIFRKRAPGTAAWCPRGWSPCGRWFPEARWKGVKRGVEDRVAKEGMAKERGGSHVLC